MKEDRPWFGSLSKEAMTAMDPSAPGKAAAGFNLFGGLMSYLIPGLGQILQGKLAKGLLFFLAIYTLFFYGIFLGKGSASHDGTVYNLNSNVYIPHTSEDQPEQSSLMTLARDVYNRPQFAGQFWVGVAAWPAIVQYYHHGSANQPNGENNGRPIREVDGREKDDAGQANGMKAKDAHPFLGQFMREPEARAVNVVNNATDKRLELAWVYTVIAGVLNILVIYDAIAGPAFGRSMKDSSAS